MSNGIVLNHHSLPFASKEDADNGLLAFFTVLKVCRTAGLKILLVDDDQDKSLMGLELANGYFVRNWFASASKVAELADWCRFLKSLETKQPLFETVDIESVDDTVEVGLPEEGSGKQVLLAAFYFETFLASFTALAAWANSHIKVWVFELDATPEQRGETLLNLSDSVSLGVHGDELKQRRNALLKTAKDIWLKRADLFPHITLLPNQIGTSLQGWSARQDVLLKARDALNVLESFSDKWLADEYVEYRHEYLRDLGLAAEVSGESDSVNNDPKKKKERMFWLDDGRHVYCENHVKLPDGYRLHFYADSANKRIYVAYLGPHLTL
ncbi:hypothetical protein RGL59_000023 [Vibrio parahaemolyticus]|uniref:hypothetical protein n=1 Tax=Vibrio TaxID=662 RepID=UPI000CE94E20|nr:MULTISPECIES: hypothetical protein [Vibrio]EGR2699822.1 hypothetical protein [Vibrio parahaemolyticus]MDW2295210.1 hypothetical protein [Vibrio sp. 1404]AVF75488.1 hypothetical protein AL539_17680 [Vibrio alginolyticus]AVF75507.1 hypothetical protein AL539_17825 [Vibrio alginolyticus]ELA8113904.1 hypothetical protein [Vibrio parahaemolyticus]